MRTTRQKFNLILTLAAMLMMAQTAWAGTTIETRTVTWKMDGGVSGQTNQTMTGTLYTTVDGANQSMVYTNNENQGFSLNSFGDFGITETNGNLSTNNGYISFPGIKGTVTKVEMVNFSFARTGLQMYVGKDRSNTSTLLHLQGNDSDFDFAADNSEDSYNKSATFVGSVAVNESTPLKIMFAKTSGGEIYSTTFAFNKGYIKVTYDAEVETTDDPGHDFTSITTSGNTLTATCTQGDPYHQCGLTNRQATLTLSIDDAPYDFVNHTASLNMQEFTSSTSLAVSSVSIVYTNKATGVERTQGEYEIGSYTATATVTISGTNYTLTKDFSILAGYKVNHNYSQFSVSKISALEGDEVTITYTQQMDEILEGLTLTGATSGNNVTYTQSGNTYTITMPAEDVNLNATITYPLNENDFAQSGDTYTIKTAEGWNYFCQRLEVDGDLNGFSGKTVMLGDNITVTTMAGSTDHPFKGMFDGDGHTLTFNYTADRPNCAPFRITNGATIRNLHATGLIEGGIWHYMGGLVGSASGNLTIENCRVSTQISSTVSGIANNGGFVGYLSSQYNQCYITGCVFDGLIYNSEYSGTTYGCSGFVGAMSQYGYAILKDCLFLHGQYDNNGGKHELWWGNENDKNSTFFHRSNGYGEGKLTNCFYVGTRGLKQGSPAVESADAPDNFAHFGDPTTDHGFLKVYGHTMVFDGKYYTPTYGDLVETYSYSGEKSYIIEYDDMPLGIKDVKTKQRTNYLRYNRPFTKDQAVTIMLPFDFTKNDIRRGEYDNISEGKFYEFAGIEEVPFNMWIAVMKEVGSDDANEVTTMKANTPYLFMPGEDAKYLYFTNGDDYYQGFDIFTEGNEGGTKVTEYEGFELRGTYTEKVWEENDPEIGKAYLIGDGGELIPVTAGTKILPTECYIIQTKKRMDGKDITVSIPAVEWTGSEVAFDASTVKVWDGTTLLTQTTDYTVTAPTGTLQDTGDYPVTITGAGEYAGTREVMFTIKGKPVTVKNDKNEDVPAATGDAEITQDQDGLTLTLTTPTESTTPHTVNVPQPVEVDHVTIDRTFEDGKACTLYLPFSIAADKIAGGTFNTFTGVDTSNPTEWIVQYSPVAGDIEANTPYIFLPNDTNGGKITVNNGSDKVSICTANQHTTEKDQWDFIGTYERIKWTKDSTDPEYTAAREAEIGSIYGFAAEEKSGATVGEFVKVGNNVWINPMRAYLKNSGTAAARGMDGMAATTELPSSMKVVIVEGTTGIKPLSISPEGESTWYSIDGRKLQGKPTTKGLYIHNGRKEVVK